MGVGLRREHFADIPHTSVWPDWFEVVPENFFRFGGRPRAVLREVGETVPVISHGVGLNIGGDQPLSKGYLNELADFFEAIEPQWFSDHLSLSGISGQDYHDLLPLPFNDAMVEHVAARAREVQERIGVPFALENPSYYMAMPGSTMSEAQFITAVLERADCGLLLDINNVYVNATNHGYDPWEFILSLPLDRVVQLHLAGHDQIDDMLFDSHGQPVPDPVWRLYEKFTQIQGPVPTLIEWDNEIPQWDRLMGEYHRACAIREEACIEFGAQKGATLPVQAQHAPPELGWREGPELPDPKDHLDLPRFFSLWRDAIAETETPDSPGVFQNQPSRLPFYAKMVRGHATRILNDLYPETQAALPVELFDELSDRYRALHPMNDYEINATASTFAEFLAQQRISDHAIPAWAPELANLEWDWFATYTHPAEPTPEDAAPQINPTLIWRTYQWRTASWWLQDVAQRPPEPEDGEENMLIYRDPSDLTVRVVPANERLLLAMKIISEALAPEVLGSIPGGEQGLYEDVLSEARALSVLVGRPGSP